MERIREVEDGEEGEDQRGGQIGSAR